MSSDKNGVPLWIANSLKFIGSASMEGVVAGLAYDLLRALTSQAGETNFYLKKLVREPFETGVRIAKEAVAMRPSSRDDKRFQREQLRLAIDSLETAISLIGARRSEERLYVYLVLGVCYYLIPGRVSKDTSRRRLSEAKGILGGMIESCEAEIKGHEDLVRRARTDTYVDGSSLPEWLENLLDRVFEASDRELQQEYWDVSREADEATKRIQGEMSSYRNLIITIDRLVDPESPTT